MASKGNLLNQGTHSAELRIVLLGGRNCGKSLVGNIILNTEEFILQERTTCLKRKAEVKGRNVVVVDTPGWWCDFSVKDTPALIRGEIKHSVSLSFPGPHIFLLVVKIDSRFKEKRRRAVEEHVELLGQTVWSHTLVLFTKGKNAGDKSFEDHLRESGKPLQWLLKKCNGRFHFLDTQETYDPTQMMGKIDKIVKENEKQHFVMDVKILQEVENRKRDVDIKAQQRLLKMHKRRSTLMEHSSHHQDIRIVLLGAKSSGKSSTGNSILATGSSFSTNKRTSRCTRKTVTEGGREVTVVDTPGWWMNYFTQDSSVFDKEELVRSVYLCPPGPSAFLLTLRVDRSFSEIYRRAIEEHLELIRKDIWNHIIVLFTFGDWLGDTTIEQYIESEGKALQWLIRRCGKRYHVLSNKSPAQRFQITELLEKIAEMAGGNGESHFEIDESLFMKMERKRKVEEAEASRRQEKVLRRKEKLQTIKNQLQLPSSVRIILIGAKNSGKTSSASCILGIGVQEGDKLIRGTAIFDETIVEVMDTPGWMTECPDLTKFSKHVLIDWISASEPNPNQTCVLLLVLNASSSFTVKKLKAVEKHLSVFGENAWSDTLVLFSNGDWLGDVSIERHIESEGDALRALVGKSGNRYHVFNNKIKDNGSQMAELMLKIREMLLEKTMKKSENPGRIERPMASAELDFRGRVRTGKGKMVPFGKSADASHGSTDVRRMPGICEILHPSTSSELSNSLTNINQSLVSRCIELSDRTSSPRNHRQRLIVVLNTSEWLEQDEPWTHFPRAIPPNVQPRHIVINESLQERFSAPTLHYPAQSTKERAFLDFFQSEGLQNLIDEWGNSNIEELEAFIDSYFEMVWQEAMKESKSSSINPTRCESSDQNHLASIDRKLSKLDILEGVQKDLKELKQSVKACSRMFQELKDRNLKTQECSPSSQHQQI
ncbi:hypothetical protein DNTS_003121 [Danionella cerebrum]|uniref:AIG1-type G domain-containing protein n=1 Tax=Danionella cerebrum TaxID=2873325 RepID=A0A553N0F5_9TELE|nr:hypothetical protein DNTS_003121 [Danionella translucida]